MQNTIYEDKALLPSHYKIYALYSTVGPQSMQ